METAGMLQTESLSSENRLFELEKICKEVKRKLNDSASQIKITIQETTEENEQLAQEIGQLEEKYHKLNEWLNQPFLNSKV